jgi:hypothetical protein
MDVVARERVKVPAEAALTTTIWPTAGAAA